MTIQYKMIASSVILTGMLVLSACNSENPVSTAPTSSPATSPSTNAVATPAPAPAPAPTPTTEPSSATQSSGSESKDLVKQLQGILELAKQGKVSGVEYAAHTGLIDEVEKAWGKADKQEPAGSGFYATYTKKNVVFGFNKGSQIFDVRSSDPQVQKLTLNQIEQALGKPADTKANGDDTIYIYKANDQFELKFIIPKSTGKVDHISVFAPKDSVNLMAQ